MISQKDFRKKLLEDLLKIFKGFDQNLFKIFSSKNLYTMYEEFGASSLFLFILIIFLIKIHLILISIQNFYIH